MCNDDSVVSRVMFSFDRHTQLGFRPYPNLLELVIGEADLTHGSGSSVHLAVYDGLIVVPNMIEVLENGLSALAGIAKSPDAETVEWPAPVGQLVPHRRRRPR